LSDRVQLQVDADGIACLTFNDPAVRNAMSVDMADALSVALAELTARADVRCVILTGAPPAFSAGGDLGMLESIRDGTRAGTLDAAAHMYAFYNQFLAISRLPVPTIAAVNGHAVGAGLCVALACDLMIVADEAKVGVNFAKLGLHPGMGASWWLPRRVGQARAAELLWTGRLIDGRTAAHYGLALESLPAKEVLPRAQTLAAEIATSAPGVVRQLKALSLVDSARTLDEQLHLEARNQAENYLSHDLAEGLLAARERRPAVFTDS
jgi:enoyl-CoA hydratase/carnithine racemase